MADNRKFFEKQSDEAEKEFFEIVGAVFLWFNSNGMPKEQIRQMLKSKIDFVLDQLDK